MKGLNYRKWGCLYAYDKRSHYLLNRYTLQIRDPEIEQELVRRRLERFESLKVPAILFFASGFFGFGILDFLNKTENLKALCYLLPYSISLVYWFVCSKLKPSWAPYYSYLVMLLLMLAVTLGFWDLLPSWLKVSRPDMEDDAVYFYLFYFSVFNYTSFFETLLVVPALFSVSYYFLLIKQVELLKFDPYSGEETAGSDSVLEWLLPMQFLLVGSIVQLYLTQKDLAICVIDQYMVQRQQTQLDCFLSNQEDPILVVSSPDEGTPEIVTLNEASKSVFNTAPTMTDCLLNC